MTIQPQTIIWPNSGVLLIGPLQININEIWIEVYNFSLKNTLENVVCKKAAIFASASMCLQYCNVNC